MVTGTAAGKLPEVQLASEHFFDDVVFGRLVRGEALPYPGGKCVLVEVGQGAFPARLQHRFFDVKRAGLTPVLAHPERYEPVWKDDACLDPLLDAGAHLLLDVCALVGKYGRAPQRAAEKLLEDDAYEAACSDAHKPQRRRRGGARHRAPRADGREARSDAPALPRDRWASSARGK